MGKNGSDPMGVGDTLTWTAFATVTIAFTAVATTLAAFSTLMPRKSLKELQEALRQAEAELAAAIKRSELDAAAKKVMWAKKALEVAKEAAERQDSAEGLD